MMSRLVKIAPELPVTHIGDALAHYEHQLGFELAMMMPDGDYAIVERDGVAIHLFQNDGNAHTPGSVHIFTPDLESLFEELARRGANVTQPIVRQAWGNRDFRIADPSGNAIKFTEPLPDDND
jgi:uncharacterized glyoxalase superfamily protein PhnB